MVQKSCFICCNQGLSSRDDPGPKEAKKNILESGDDCKFVANQLQVIFLLRKLLEIPEDTCCKLLSHFGNPNLWIECCDSCSNLVEKCQSILDQIASLEKHYDELRMDIKYKILKSQKHFDYECQCETVLRSQIISKDVDYFIKTTASERSKVTSLNANTDNNKEDITTEGLISLVNEEAYSQTHCAQIFVSSNINPLTTGAEPINSFTQDTANNKIDFHCNSGDFDENEEHFLNFDGDTDIKPQVFILEQESESERLPLFDEAFENHLDQNILTSSDVPDLVNCLICGKGFATSNSLKRHMVIHSNAKPYKCNTCGKSFNNNSNYNRHKKMHSNVKPYQCDMCGQRFHRTGLLKGHNAIHTTDRKYPFTCVMCDKSFTELQSLKVHYRQHTEEKNKCYKCLVCGKSFKVLNALKQHNLSHSGHKPLK